MNGSIRLITGPEKSRVETRLGCSDSGQTFPLAAQRPLEASVLFVNRRSLLQILYRRWASQTPSHRFPVKSMERQTLDSKSLACSGGAGALYLQERSV